ASGLVSFTSTSTGVSGGTTYTWYLGDGSPPVTGVSSLSYTYKYNGTYYVFLNLNNSSTGCSSWKIDSVKITNATTCSLTAAFNYNMGNNGTASFMNNTSGADAGVTYTWDPGDGSSSVNGSSFTHTYAYNGYYLVTLSAQNSGYGCTSQQAQYVLVNTAPPCNIVPSFKYTSGPGGIINFTSTSTGANPGAIYYWDPGDGSPMVPGKNTFSYKYDYNNTYYAEMYVEDSGYNGCLAYYVDSIKVSNGTSCKLKAKFNYVAGASGKVNFNSTSTGVTPGAEYYWYFGDNTQAETTLNTFTHSYTYDGTYYAELGIMDTGYGCYSYYDTSVTISNAWVCNVRPKITAVTGANGQVNFSSSSSSGVYPGASYYWYFYDGTSGTGSTCSHTFTYNGNYYVDLSISDTGGYCSGQADTDINISNALPCNLVVSFNAAYGANGQVVFTNTSSGVYPGATINWSFGDGTYGTGNTCTHTYTYNGNYYVYLSIADSGYGCTSSFNEMITITNGRECNLHASFNSILGSNGLVNFNNTSTGLYPGASNSWYFGDGNVANTANCTHVYTANGNYYVSLYVSDSGYGCYSSWDTLLSITNANPTNGCNLNVSFSYGRNYGRQISFANSTQGVTAGSTYDWYFGDGSYGAGSHCIHNYSKDGRYLVQLEINSNGCYSIGRDSITVYNDTIVQFQSNTLYTYPNPNNGSFTLYLQNIPLNSYADISVDNVIGQEMYRWGVTINNTGNMYIPMDIPGLQAGIYFIRVTVMGQVYTTKMCVYR
ncbi:MAG TPA: PKD domain-containing protein, partial [Bacteroidia bacterium]|nr:PKD domain-containing protein [Bacteroidia bacterium]